MLDETELAETREVTCRRVNDSVHQLAQDGGTTLRQIRRVLLVAVVFGNFALTACDLVSSAILVVTCRDGAITACQSSARSKTSSENVSFTNFDASNVKPSDGSPGDPNDGVALGVATYTRDGTNYIASVGCSFTVNGAMDPIISEQISTTQYVSDVHAVKCGLSFGARETGGRSQQT